MAVEAVVGRLELDPADRLDLVGPRRRDEVVEERAAAGEALDAEQLLGVEAAVRGAVLGVPLAGHAAAGDVEHARLASSVEEASLGRRDGQPTSPAPGRGVDSGAMPVQSEAEFRAILTGEKPGFDRNRRFLERIPSPPRCKLCSAPFAGPGGTVLRHFGYRRFAGNPSLCENCIRGYSNRKVPRRGDPAHAAVRRHPRLDGAGRAPPAQRVPGVPRRFYRIASEVILHHDGIVDKLVGDEVVALFIGGISRPGRTPGAAIAAAIGAARPVWRAGRDADGADPRRGGRPHRRGVRRDRRARGRGDGLHRARRSREHGGPAGVRGRGRRAADHRRRGPRRRDRPGATPRRGGSTSAAERRRSSRVVRPGGERLDV